MTPYEMIIGLDWQDVRRQKACLQALVHKLNEDGLTVEGRALESTIMLLHGLQEVGVKALNRGQKSCETVYGKKSKNSNCLENIRCPKCGHEDDVNITVVSVVNMVDDGTDFEGADADWDGMSAVRCSSCGRHGKAWEFSVG